MKAQTNRLTFSQQFFIATMLFGLFFGAGNLIFPIFLGSQAGRNVWPAITGLLITGVGIPLLGVAAQGISRSNGLQEMAGRVSPRYSTTRSRRSAKILYWRTILHRKKKSKHPRCRRQ